MSEDGAEVRDVPHLKMGQRKGCTISEDRAEVRDILCLKMELR
jgi:hypothetical protein